MHEPLLSPGGFEVRHMEANGVLATTGGLVVRLQQEQEQEQLAVREIKGPLEKKVVQQQQDQHTT